MARASVNTQGRTAAWGRNETAMLRRRRDGKNHWRFPPGGIGRFRPDQP